MAFAFLNLLVGLVSIIAVCGLGRLLMRPLGPLPLHWYATGSMLAGIALTTVFFQCLAMAGSGRMGYGLLGSGILIVGIAGHWIGRARYSRLPLPEPGPVRSFAFGLLTLVLAVLLLISLAPSTKIDELYYHMLTGRRVLEDGGLLVYQLPFEQAIIPQMGYQIAETAFHAVNVPDAGNVLSLGFGVVLWLLIYGAVTEESGKAELGLLATVASAIGLFPAVWYVTSGAHALGDLATFTAVSALFFSGGLAKAADDTWDETRTFVCVLGATCAASTKISLIPVAALITVAAVLRLRDVARMRMGIVAAGLWLTVLGPLVAWTYIHTGSPFGVAFAQYFKQTAYQPVAIQALEDSRVANQTGWGFAAYYAVEFLNAGGLTLIVCGILSSCRQWTRFGGLLFLVILQIALIAIFLPHDFRFLGGLQYGVLAVGAIGLTPFSLARVPTKWVAACALLLLGPWLGAELYYARPFAAIVLGGITRDEFLKRYVAFTVDFRALNKALPRDANIYVPNSRLPAVYAPRPVIFTLADWNRSAPLYRLLVEHPGESADADVIESQASLACGEVLYRNSDAVVFTYRTPNRTPDRDTVVVQKCILRTTLPLGLQP